MVAAGERAGERYWQLPLVDDYVPEMDSWYGDLTNSGSPEGSLVKSGLFLREFVTVPWVHLDIAGTAYYRKALPFAPRGATGRLARDAGRAGARGRAGRLTGHRRTDPPGLHRRPMEPLSVLLGAAGFVLGLAADRLGDPLAGA